MPKTATATSVTPIGKAVEGRPTGQMGFKPVDYDVTDIPPEAPEGKWTGVLKVGKKDVNKEGYARLGLMLKLEETEEPDHESYLGQSVRDSITFYDNKHPYARMSKRQLQGLCAALEIDLEVIPKRIRSWADLKPLIAAIDGQKLEFFTVVRNTDDGPQTNVRYTAPGGYTTGLAVEEEEEEEQEEEEEEAEKTPEAEPEEEEIEEPEEEEEEETPPPPPPTGRAKKTKK
jgi:hypothetical protein